MKDVISRVGDASTDIEHAANLLAVPAFKRRFGSPIADGSYEVTAAWQAGNGAYVCEMLKLTFF